MYKGDKYIRIKKFSDGGTSNNPYGIGDRWKDTGFGIFMSSDIGKGVGAATAAIGKLAPQNGGAASQAIKQGIRAITDKLGPIGAAVGMADDLLGGIAGMAGKSLSGLSAGDKAIAAIPVIGNLASFFGSTLEKKNFDLDKVASDYSTNKESDAAALGGQQILFGSGKRKRQIQRAWELYNQKADISEYNKKRMQNDVGQLFNERNMMSFSGQDQSYSLAAKRGMKFPELDEARLLISSWAKKQIESKEGPQKFQIGGKMNTIPTGSLHARKHNLEEINPELKDQITNKGIPVITYSEGGITQTAEIERDEWTLRKEFTDELESLYKLYEENPSDEIAIKAGKLVCYELLKNTDDKGGLIKKVK